MTTFLILTYEMTIKLKARGNKGEYFLQQFGFMIEKKCPAGCFYFNIILLQEKISWVSRPDSVSASS